MPNAVFIICDIVNYIDGFRKVKADPLDRSQWWIFRHSHFLRGHPELLSEIKRSVHFAPEAASTKEVSELKSQVSSLTERIAALNMQVEKLSNTVSMMTASKNSSTATTKVDTLAKKRRLSVDISPDIFSQQKSNELLEDSTFEDGLNIDMMLEEESTDDVFDVDTLLELIETSDDPNNAAEHHQQEIQTSVPASDFTAVKDFSNFLDELSPELKERFVDKLAEAMAVQLANGLSNNQVQMMPSTNVSVPAAIPVMAEVVDEVPSKSSPAATSSQFILPSGEQAPDIAFPLASAALITFLMRSSLLQSQNVASHIKNLQHTSSA